MSLTLRQKQILEFIGRFIEKRGYGPSLMEIGAEIDESPTSEDILLEEAGSAYA